LITRNDCPSSCQSKVAPDLILNRSRNAFGTTVCPLLVTVLVMVRISFSCSRLASQKIGNLAVSRNGGLIGRDNFHPSTSCDLSRSGGGHGRVNDLIPHGGWHHDTASQLRQQVELPDLRQANERAAIRDDGFLGGHSVRP
jgi:hypothetical protein